jgi:hypothetical protein
LVFFFLDIHFCDIGKDSINAVSSTSYYNSGRCKALSWIYLNESFLLPERQLATAQGKGVIMTATLK